MKRLILIFAVFSLLFTAFPVFAAEVEETQPQTNIPREPGWCGEEITWSYDPDTFTLTVSGAGRMDDFPEGAPWLEYREELKTLVFSGTVSYIGAKAFEDFDALTDVYFGSHLQELGPRSFYSCDGLTRIDLPATFRCFGEESLRNCTFLKQIHCMGGMPSFRLNCLWDTWADIFYPVNNPWPLEHIEQLESAFQGRIEFLADDGSDPFVPTEATTPPTEQTEPSEEETEPTTEATEPPTEPSTEVTEPPTEATEPPTEPSTEETAPQTQPVTEPSSEPEQTQPQPQENSRMGSWIGGAIIGMVLSALGLGALVFGRNNRRGKGGRGRYSR